MLTNGSVPKSLQTAQIMGNQLFFQFVIPISYQIVCFHGASCMILTVNAAIIVATDAPIKPSHVFFGDNLIRGVFPKKKPKIYAATSFIAIRDAGKRNLQNNVNIFCYNHD